MHTLVKRPLREAAVGAGNDTFLPDDSRQSDEALCNQIRVFDDVCPVTNNAGDQDFTFGQRRSFPDTPFVFVTRIGTFEDVRTRPDAEYQIHDLLQRHIACVWAGPTAPAAT